MIRCLFAKSAVPESTPVERQGGGGAPARAPSPPPPVSGVDYFKADQHHGSPRLDMWPPSHEELHMAGRLYTDPTDFAAAKDLRTLTGSARRSAAILRHVHKLADAAGIVARVVGGPL